MNRALPPRGTFGRVEGVAGFAGRRPGGGDEMDVVAVVVVVVVDVTDASVVSDGGGGEEIHPLASTTGAGAASS